ncbi:class I SAM-dependent methyltransferase [Aerococcus sanguinicola]|uniref:class I SAM-dependent methyltransferase n=1 Tax=unclassified Aerococcus TaxID=2618060 RepID=UPI0008A3C614|nr:MULTISPECIES: class I SAM-dependent methyltransferase [unclassified Aerococcus]KAB0646694.1 methyltransferase domain-containing protein [Aerococcus sanguinicola]MDK6233837.1 methyltransferase domain-containing protein [Aerococcus sp. UMB10185]MDK6856332.1 methyltransferase domain-containing protein [Aerococcus sp. UMB7533]MDK8503199.1 methyltransferase domain-containing protein [Aerococcus sp. UMB1112A]OFN04662.1 hypothetical protein HMPREF2626_04440 [Aerococcus sp. HMSC062A02]
MAIFDDHAKDYDRWYDKPMGKFVDKVETDLAFSLLTVQPGMRVLDAGCGTGNYSIKLAKHGAEVVGIDVSRAMLGQAEANVQAENLEVDFQLMDMEDLAFEDNSFDAVLSMTAIEFVEDLDALYREFRRVVKPGGQILLGSITKSGAWGQAYSDKGGDIYSQAHFRDLAELRSLDEANLVDTAEGLFVLPNSDPAKLSSDLEMSLSEKGRAASFACVLFEKADRVQAKLTLAAEEDQDLSQQRAYFLDRIESSGIPYDLSEADDCVTLRGNAGEVFRLLEVIHQQAALHGDFYDMRIDLKNRLD